MTHPGEQPTPAPTVTTAPPTRRRIPSHLGPARTSTVVLAVLWLALGTLYLNVRPENPAVASSVGRATVQTTEPGPATTAPATTVPAPTTTRSATQSTVPTSSTETTIPASETTGSVEPTAPSTTLPTATPTVAPTS